MSEERTYPLFPRDERGRALTKRCPDPNCGGTLRYGQSGREPFVDRAWRCDGLTHLTENGPLFACEQALAA